MITRLPKMTDLAIRDEVKEILNDYFMQQIIGRVCQGTLTEIPGIDTAVAGEISIALLASVGCRSDHEEGEVEATQPSENQHQGSSESGSKSAEQKNSHDELTEEEFKETKCLLGEIKSYVDRHFWTSLGDDFIKPTATKFKALQKAAENMSDEASLKFLYAHYGIHGEERQKNLLACLDVARPHSSHAQYEVPRFYNRARSRLYSAFMPIYAEMIFATPEEIPIIFLGLSTAPYNAIYRAGYETVGDLIQVSRVTLLRVRNLGEKSLEEVILRLDRCGYHLAD